MFEFVSRASHIARKPRKCELCGYDMSVKVYGLYAYIASDREDIMLAADMKLASVIGNIHDNPELLMKRNEDNLGDD